MTTSSVTPGESLRAVLERPGVDVCPVVANPLLARIAESLGFEVVGIGGYALGMNEMVPEPLLTLDTVARASRQISEAVHVPVLVDAGAGYGEPLHVAHTVRQLERTGLAGIQLEDQQFPKRAHYHKGVEETISAQAMVEKLDAAVAARHDPSFVIVARTDAILTEGFDAAVERSAAYLAAGADAILMFPSDRSEAARLPGLVDAPVIYSLSEGNPFVRPVPHVEELGAWGYSLVRNLHLATLVAYEAVRDALSRWRDLGTPLEDPAGVRRTRQELEELLGLPQAYATEERTVLRSAPKT